MDIEFAINTDQQPVPSPLVSAKYPARSNGRKRKTPPDGSTQHAPKTKQPPAQPPPSQPPIAPTHTNSIVQHMHANPAAYSGPPITFSYVPTDPNSIPQLQLPLQSYRQATRSEEDLQGDESPGNASNGRPLSGTKRAEQNRKAQKAFRERRDQHVKTLESRSALLDTALASANEANQRWEECQRMVEQLRAENAALRSALNQVGQSHMIPVPIPPGSVIMSSGGQGVPVNIQQGTMASGMGVVVAGAGPLLQQQQSQQSSNQQPSQHSQLGELTSEGTFSDTLGVDPNALEG